MTTFSGQTDNTLIQLFLPIINAGLTADGFDGVTVMQSNQPSMQGINTAPTIYFFKIGNKRYGFLGRYNKWNANTSQMVHTEAQYIESTWQMSALALQNPSNIDLPTASDYINEVASIMQSDATRDILNESGVGVLRVSDISNPYFLDDRDNFEAHPSFDITFVYENFRTNDSPVVSTLVPNFIGV